MHDWSIIGAHPSSDATETNGEQIAENSDRLTSNAIAPVRGIVNPSHLHKVNQFPVILWNHWKLHLFSISNSAEMNQTVAHSPAIVDTHESKGRNSTGVVFAIGASSNSNWSPQGKKVDNLLTSGTLIQKQNPAYPRSSPSEQFRREERKAQMLELPKRSFKGKQTLSANGLTSSVFITRQTMIVNVAVNVPWRATKCGGPKKPQESQRLKNELQKNKECEEGSGARDLAVVRTP
jgi:hypothetical protein